MKWRTPVLSSKRASIPGMTTVGLSGVKVEESREADKGRERRMKWRTPVLSLKRVSIPAGTAVGLRKSGDKVEESREADKGKKRRMKQVNRDRETREFAYDVIEHYLELQLFLQMIERDGSEAMGKEYKVFTSEECLYGSDPM